MILHFLKISKQVVIKEPSVERSTNEFQTTLGFFDKKFAKVKNQGGPYDNKPRLIGSFAKM